MVTARLESADFVTGKCRANWKKIPPAEWSDIILAAMKDMNVAYLSTLQSLNQVLTRPRRYATGPSAGWLWNPALLQGDEINLQTADLLFLTELLELPGWKNWPVEGLRLAPHDELMLLAKREKDGSLPTLSFFTLKSTWCPSEEGNNATHLELRRVENFRDYFCFLGRDAHWVGRDILMALHSAQSSTRSAAEERAKYAREGEARLRGYMDRAGIL